MTLARAAFAFIFGDVPSIVENSSDLQRAFWLGFRFDLMPLAYINALPFLILNFAYFFPGKLTVKISRFLMVTLLWLGYTLLIWLYIFDYGFYSYFQNHLNILFFVLFEDDLFAIVTSIYKNYNIPLWSIVLGVFHYLLFRLIKFSFSRFEFDLKARPFSLKMPIVFFLGIFFLTLFARGNISQLALSVEDAFISDEEFINEIALNGAMTLNRAIRIRKSHRKDEFNYLKNSGFKDWKEAFQAYYGKKPKAADLSSSLIRRTRKNASLETNPPHVVLVVMANFGTYWNDLDAEDFQILGELKDHLSKGFYFKNFLPSDNGTIGSIVSIATSQVVRPGSRFLSESEYMKTPLASAGHIPFKESGYETHFIFGGKLGWRDLGKYLGRQKYDYLWGGEEIREAIPEINHLAENDIGSEWGIYDEYLYTFIDERLRTSIKPQFFLVLTTSNHPPFDYPSSYRPLPLTVSSDILSRITVDEELARKKFLGLQYANQKIGEFLTRIHKSPLGNNTIVALTGDHSFWIAKGAGQEEEFKRYAVPFFLSVPESYKPSHVDLSKFGSHEDIFPTLINLSLSSQTYLKLGEDLFSETDSPFAMNSSGLVANKKGAYHHDRFWKWKDLEQQILEPGDQSPELNHLWERGKGLISVTDLYLKEEKKSKRLVLESDLP